MENKFEARCAHCGKRIDEKISYVIDGEEYCVYCYDELFPKEISKMLSGWSD